MKKQIITDENKELFDVLKAAFEVCFIVEDTLSNVIAGSNIPDKGDIEYRNKARKYIKWYKKKFKK